MHHPTLIHQRVAACNAGTNPAAICKLASGWVVLGDSQLLPGYCLLLADPVAPSLNALVGADRARFLDDMAAVGDALLSCTDAVRINYEILGNQDPALHAHIFPRYATEPAERLRAPVWLYSREERASVPFDLRRDKPLIDAIRVALQSPRA